MKWAARCIGAALSFFVSIYENLRERETSQLPSVLKDYL